MQAILPALKQGRHPALCRRPELDHYCLYLASSARARHPPCQAPSHSASTNRSSTLHTTSSAVGRVRNFARAVEAVRSVRHNKTADKTAKRQFHITTTDVQQERVSRMRRTDLVRIGKQHPACFCFHNAGKEGRKEGNNEKCEH